MSSPDDSYVKQFIEKGNQKLQFTVNNYILVLCINFNFHYDDYTEQFDNARMAG